MRRPESHGFQVGGSPRLLPFRLSLLVPRSPRVQLFMLFARVAHDTRTTTTRLAEHLAAGQDYFDDWEETGVRQGQRSLFA